MITWYQINRLALLIHKTTSWLLFFACVFVVWFSWGGQSAVQWVCAIVGFFGLLVGLAEATAEVTSKSELHFFKPNWAKYLALRSSVPLALGKETYEEFCGLAKKEEEQTRVLDFLDSQEGVFFSEQDFLKFLGKKNAPATSVNFFRWVRKSPPDLSGALHEIPTINKKFLKNPVRTQNILAGSLAVLALMCLLSWHSLPLGVLSNISFIGSLIFGALAFACQKSQTPWIFHIFGYARDLLDSERDEWDKTMNKFPGHSSTYVIRPSTAHLAKLRSLQSQKNTEEFLTEKQKKDSMETVKIIDDLKSGGLWQKSRARRMKISLTDALTPKEDPSQKSKRKL